MYDKHGSEPFTESDLIFCLKHLHTVADTVNGSDQMRQDLALILDAVQQLEA